jgi:hypothetical protein
MDQLSGGPLSYASKKEHEETMASISAGIAYILHLLAEEEAMGLALYVLQIRKRWVLLPDDVELKTAYNNFVQGVAMYSRLYSNEETRRIGEFRRKNKASLIAEDSDLDIAENLSPISSADESGGEESL